MPKDTPSPKRQEIELSVISASASTSAAASSKATSAPSTSAAAITQTLVKTNAGSQISLRDLPSDLFGSGGEIFTHLHASDFRRLIIADPKLFPSLRNDKGAKEKFFNPLHELLTHIINANLPAAENLIKENPGLLREEGQVTQKIDDETSYSDTGTALSIALGLGDISIYPDHHEEMVDMICRYLRTLPNGEAEIARQIKKYFPDGFIEVKPYDFNAICTAIINSSDADVQAALSTPKNNTTMLDQALKHFRAEFAKCPRNSCHIAAAFTVYDTHFDNLRTWEKRSLFCIQVIGFVQRYLPPCDLYAFKQGIYNVVENKQRLTRDGFEFEDWVTPGSNGTQKINVFGPVGLHSGLGFNFCLCCWCGGGVGVGWAFVGEARCGVRLQNLCRAKTGCLENFIRASVQPHPTPDPRGRCQLL